MAPADVPMFTEPAAEVPAQPAAPAVEADAPPKRRSRSGSRTRKAPADKAPRSRSGSRPPTKAQQTRQIAETMAAVHELAGGLLLPMAGRPATGAKLAEQAAPAGEWWAAMAARYPALARLFAATGDGMLFVQGIVVYAPVVRVAMAEQRGDADPAAAGAGPDLLGGVLSMMAAQQAAQAQQQAQAPEAPAA